MIATMYIMNLNKLLYTKGSHTTPQVWWQHNGSPISITSPRGGVSIETEKEGRKLLSRLSVVHALASDAGNYTCGPDLVNPANVTVYVVEGKFSLRFDDVKSLLL